jgi:hypothetical protein
MYGRLFSMNNMVRTTFAVATFAVLNLSFTGAASAQGLPAGTLAPVYGTTWAAAQAPSHSLDAPTMASEPSKASDQDQLGGSSQNN